MREIRLYHPHTTAVDVSSALAWCEGGDDPSRVVSIAGAGSRRHRMTGDLVIYTVVALGVLLLMAGPSQRRRRASAGPAGRASRRTRYEICYTHGYQSGYR